MKILLRFHRKRSGSPSSESYNDDGISGLLSELNEHHPLENKYEFSNTETMDLLRTKNLLSPTILKSIMDLIPMTGNSLEHTKKRSDSSSSESSTNDRNYGIISALQEYDYFHRISGLKNSDLFSLLFADIAYMKSLMSSNSPHHARKRSSSSSSMLPTEEYGTGHLSTLKDYDSMNHNARWSKNSTMDIHRGEMMAHTSLRHTTRQEESPMYLKNLPRL